jgi:hypothetical protein
MLGRLHQHWRGGEYPAGWVASDDSHPGGTDVAHNDDRFLQRGREAVGSRRGHADRSRQGQT